MSSFNTSRVYVLRHAESADVQTPYYSDYSPDLCDAELTDWGLERCMKS